MSYCRRFSEDVLTSEQIRMLNDGFVQKVGGVLTDNQDGMSAIIVPDAPAANGVIQPINAVLMTWKL